MSVPLHERIRADIEAAIFAGDLVPGDRLPVEQELTRTYNCSRMTVSRALSALTSAGLIERRRRAGSFVARPRMQSMILDIPDLAHEIASRGQSYAFCLLGRVIRPARASVPRERALAGAGEVLLLTGIHFADGKPLALEDRLITLAAVPAAAQADFAAVSPGAWLLDHVPWTEAETRIAAENVSPEHAALLAVPPGSAALVVERRTWRGKERITDVRQSFIGDGYAIVARFGAAYGAATSTPAAVI